MFVVFLLCSFAYIPASHLWMMQVSEEVERALARLGPARVNGRYAIIVIVHFVIVRSSFGTFFLGGGIGSSVSLELNYYWSNKG